MTLAAMNAMAAAESARMNDSWRCDLREDAEAIGLPASVRDWAERVAGEVSNITSIPADEILGKSKMKEIALARHLCWHQMRKFGFSYVAIGVAFDMDHASVIYGVRRVEKILSEREAQGGEVVNIMENAE